MTSYFVDKGMLEEKVKAVKIDKDSFMLKYYPQYKDNVVLWDSYTKYFLNAKWKWTVWWNDHDEKFYASLIMSVALIFGVPELWDNVDILNSMFPYNGFVSIGIGYAGSQISKFILNKVKKKADEI